MTGEQGPRPGYGWKARVGRSLLASGYGLLFVSTFTTSALALLVTMTLGVVCLAASVVLWLMTVLADVRHHGVL